MDQRRTGKTYRPWNPECYRQQAHSPATKLPEDDLVFFLIETVPLLDLSKIYAPYEDETRGAPPFDPTMMVCLLLYAYCMGVTSSRKIARACERNLAFLAIVGLDRPDFRTISDFRKIQLDAFKDLFVEVLRLAREAGLIRLGHIAIDGTKMPGNASRHKAMSYGYMEKEIERLRGEIDQLVHQAEHADAEEDAALGSCRGDELPEELQRREGRLAKILEAKQRLEEQARAAAGEERQRREDEEAERQRTGQKRRGREPGPVEEKPEAKAQTSFTDPELKIMKTNNKGWDYCGNAQASVDGAHQIIVACEVVDASNDKQQGVPMAQATKANLAEAGVPWPQDEGGQATAVPASMDSGYFSKEAVAGVEQAGFDPHISTGRERHQGSSSGLDGGPAASATPKERMAAKLKTESGRKAYGKRKGIVEPVFGQIKGARGIRRFLLRGQEKIRGEWRLICLTHNLLKIWRYRPAPV